MAITRGSIPPRQAKRAAASAFSRLCRPGILISVYLQISFSFSRPENNHPVSQESTAVNFFFAAEKVDPAGRQMTQGKGFRIIGIKYYRISG